MTVIRIRTSYGWEDVTVQGPPGIQGPQGIQGIQGPQGDVGPAGPIWDPDANLWRGYAFRMVSGEAQATVGNSIRAAQQNNNIYNNSAYFQGWLAGLATAVKCMKTGLIRVEALLYYAVLAAGNASMGIYKNGVEQAEHRQWCTTTNSQSLLISEIVQVSAGDTIGFQPTSNCTLYQGTDYRFTRGHMEYISIAS